MRTAAAALLLALATSVVACVPPAVPPLPLSPSDSTAYLAARVRAERKARKMKIRRDHDRITGITTVSLPLLEGGVLSGGTRVVASFAHEGTELVTTPDAVLFTVDWEELGGPTQLLDAPDAHFLVDDSVRFTGRGRDWERYVDRSLLELVFQDSTLRQRVTIEVAPEDFARMTAGRRVEARLTNGETFVLHLEHLIALGRLEERMVAAAR